MIKVQPFWTTELSTGENYCRSMILVDGYLYMLTQTNPSKLIKLRANDGGDKSVVTFADDGKHKNGIDLTYTGGKIYAYFATAVSPTPTHVYVSQVAPDTLSVTDVIDDPDWSGTNGAIGTDGTYLYVSTFGNSYEVAVVLQYDLSDFSKTGTCQFSGSQSPYGVPNSPIFITCDSGKLYTGGDGHASQPAWWARINTSTMGLEQFQWYTAINTEQGRHGIVLGSYLWTAIRSQTDGGLFVRSLKTDLSSYVTYAMSTGDGWPATGVIYDDKYLWAIPFGNISRIDPDTQSIITCAIPLNYYGSVGMSVDTSSNVYIADYNAPIVVGGFRLGNAWNYDIGMRYVG